MSCATDFVDLIGAFGIFFGGLTMASKAYSFFGVNPQQVHCPQPAPTLSFSCMHPATDDGPSRGAGPQHGQEGSQEIIARANGQGLYCTRVWSVVGGLAAYDAVPTGQRRG